MVEIQKIIEEIRLGLQADGGDVELAETRPDGTIVLRLTGKSKGCELMGVPLNEAIKAYIQRANSQIRSIEFV